MLESTWSDTTQSYWPTSQIDHGFHYTLAPAPVALNNHFGPYAHMFGAHQYHHAPTMYAAAPAHQYMPLAHTVPISQPQSDARLTNGVFVPNANDIARGRINQAVYEARFRHQYTDNTDKAGKARILFDHYFGINPKSLLAWQDMCYFCGGDPENMPVTIKACKVFLRNKHVNIFDFVAAVDEFMSSSVAGRIYDMKLLTFANARKLEQYSREKGLICPAKIGRGNDLFRFMLAKWF